MALTGKTVVITGAASGIGHALAAGFLRDGARVVAADLNEAGLTDLADAGAITCVTDVSDREAVHALVARAVEATGRLDVLFNNAGIGGWTRVEDLQPGEFERFTAVHVFGALYGMQAALPVMRSQGCGRIINTLSRAAETRSPKWAAYAAAKASLFSLTRIAASEVRDVDILINGMIPGPTRTGMLQGDELQEPEAVYPSALWLATLPAGGPSGQVFWNRKPYHLFGGERDRQSA